MITDEVGGIGLLLLSPATESPTVNPTTAAPTLEPLSVQYSLWNRTQDNMPAECLYELTDLGKKVPDTCCAKAPTKQAPLDFKGKTCTSFPLGKTYIRDYLGCDDGVVTFGEACTPAGTLPDLDVWFSTHGELPPVQHKPACLVLTGTSFGKGYPMSAAKDEDASNVTQCGCSNSKQPPLQQPQSIYTGVGCFVAVTAYQLGDNASSTAFFANVKGSCTTAAPTATIAPTTAPGMPTLKRGWPV